MNKVTALFCTALLGASCAAFAHAQTGTAAPAQASAIAPPAPPAGPGGPGGPVHGHGMHRGPEGPGGGPGGPEGRLLPPGTWWRNQDVVSRIGLSADQQKRIDGIFLESRVQLIHMHASLEEDQLRLDGALQATPFNQNEALAQSNKVADMRADLEKANAKMLLTIRGVLTADQWTKLQAAGPGPGTPPARMGDGKRGDHRNGSRGARLAGPDGAGGPASTQGFLPSGA